MAGELQAVGVNAMTPPQSKLHKGKGSSLTQEQLAAIVKLHALDKTQTEIAEIVGCDQASVSRWLTKLTDDGQLAAAYLRANQFRLAKTIVSKARASDAIDVLDRFKSLPASSKADASTGLTIQIGIKDSDVSLTLSPGETSLLERKGAESLAITAGSDNPSSVNQR